MRTTRLIAVLVGMAAIAILTADASAYYHPTLGRFMQRDPGAGGANRIVAGGAPAGGGFVPRDPTGSNQYADGMNLYQYVKNRPLSALDPDGRRYQEPDEVVEHRWVQDDYGNWVPPYLGSSGLKSETSCCGGKEYDPKTSCCENDKVVAKVEIGLIVRGKYSEAHEPGAMAQHADATLGDGSLVGYFGEPNGGASNGIGLGLNGIVARTPWFNTNRPYYNDAALAKRFGVVSTHCTLAVCPAQAEKFKQEWAAIEKNPGTFDILGGNCSTRAGQCFAAAGVTSGGIPGLDTPNNLYKQLKAQYGNDLKCQSGYFGYNAGGKPFVDPLPPGTPIPDTKGKLDATLSQ